METKNIIISVVMVIIAVIVIFQFVGTASTNMTAGATSITQANSCSSNTGVNAEALTYNSTTDLCDNSTAFGVADYSVDLPLESLFSPSGVVLLIVMAGLLLAVILLVLKRVKQ